MFFPLDMRGRWQVRKATPTGAPVRTSDGQEKARFAPSPLVMTSVKFQNDL
jgi:hypothetical protein